MKNWRADKKADEKPIKLYLQDMYMALTEYKQSSSSSESEKTDDKPILIKRPIYQFNKCTNDVIKKIKQKIVKS